MLLGDLGDPPAHRVAKVLGVSLLTVQPWNRTGNAPRAACLAIFWLTRWSRSQVNCQAVNDASLAVQHSVVLKAELARVQLRLESILALLPVPPGAGGRQERKT
ncbi:MAG: hypothetical protein DI603_16270 [Roseateles depolymerans]|uniref:Uncharacterized protein n=1 Tax=Roseateles depolymerans TaxID=76731 RepID=A0A2W5DLI1_9BURK|nr:MAG: hypothetical protein DI603_16270 [Roseateles depolymerans]